MDYEKDIIYRALSLAVERMIEEYGGEAFVPKDDYYTSKLQRALRTRKYELETNILSIHLKGQPEPLPDGLVVGGKKL